MRNIDKVDRRVERTHNAIISAFKEMIIEKEFKQITIKELAEASNEKNLVSPFLVMGGTDAYNYEPVCENIYRFAPFVADTKLLLCTHGTNERIPIACCEDAIAFFKRYVRKMTQD